MLPKIDYTVLRDAALSLGYEELPPQEDVTEEMKATDEDFQRKVHHALLDIHVIDAQLVCPETERPFPVTGGIHNMLLHEDEV
jgi:multifunctional methyltransferase subunit TRM112